MNFIHLSSQYPPILCRLLARRGKNRNTIALTTPEIVAGSGLTEFEVVTIAEMTSWDRVHFSTMLAFLRGCRIDFCNWRQMSRMRELLARADIVQSPWGHLRRSKEWLSYYERLLKRYALSVS